ncbi:nucleoside-diphosphate sugar epimerase/dehydratase [Polaromonas sp.]|uniref:polysaccharide biosynthesis protein n=1 Tax=Polaromonas sp. TaxID=1869339 RepID=UPI0025DD8F65|nr:nucleoside-diphosphate sugar epimerase/dehydratase [Polaromonas sp.]
MRLRKEVLPLWGIDMLLVGAAWWAAFWLRFNFEIPDTFETLIALSLPWILVCYTVGLGIARVYRQVWRYIGLPELRQLTGGVLLASLLSAAIVLMMRYQFFPRSVLLLHPLIALVLLSAVRAGWRTLTEHSAPADGSKPLLIVGSLREATDALRAIKGSRQWHCVGIVSPLPGELGTYLNQVPVLGSPASVVSIAQATGASTALIASPPGSDERREVLSQSSQAGLTLMTMPRPDEWLKSDSSSPRRIELEDLLGRQAVELDMRGLAELFSGQTVLVSGAGGSIGSELCRQIARLGVSRLVCVDASEIAIYKLEQELRETHPQMKGLYYTANIREEDRLRAIAMHYKPSVFFHAAAYKHVPLMESHNEIEAIRTNILGTLHAARVAGECGAHKFVQISTDKAVNPTNIMGATKRMAELVVQSVALEYTGTEFVSVRFGNVLGSSGSVVPLFTDQIAKGGPITVTHPDIVRYFMTIPEAAKLVLQAGLMGKSGQIFVLDMGDPVKIADLARIMIQLSGKTEQEVPLAFTGLRPGEKLFEELLADDETTEPTPHPKLRVAKTSGEQAVHIGSVQDWIESAGPAPSSSDIRAWLKGHLPEYKSQA